MAEKPDYVLNFEHPPRTEIKKIGNGWYLYERFSRYDPELKRSRKISGRCLGKITPEGFVVSKRFSETLETAEPFVGFAAEVGASVFCWRRTGPLRERLKKHFPELWKRLYVAALLFAVKSVRFARLQHVYEACFLNFMYPGLAFDRKANDGLLEALEGKSEAISAFGCEDCVPLPGEAAADGYPVVLPFGEEDMKEHGSAKRFINGIVREASLSVAKDTLKACAANGMTPEEFIQCLEQITAVCVDGIWRLVPVRRSIRAVLENAGLALTPLDLAEILFRCSGSKTVKSAVRKRNSEEKKAR